MNSKDSELCWKHSGLESEWISLSSLLFLTPVSAQYIKKERQLRWMLTVRGCLSVGNCVYCTVFCLCACTSVQFYSCECIYCPVCACVCFNLIAVEILSGFPTGERAHSIHKAAVRERGTLQVTIQIDLLRDHPFKRVCVCVHLCLKMQSRPCVYLKPVHPRSQACVYIIYPCMCIQFGLCVYVCLSACVCVCVKSWRLRAAAAMNPSPWVRAVESCS